MNTARFPSGVGKNGGMRVLAFETDKAWILAGGAHHTSFSPALTAEHLRDFATMAGIEFIRIGTGTEIASLENELRWTSQPRFHLEVGLVKLAKVGHVREIEEVLREIKGTGNSPAPQKPMTAVPQRPPAPATQKQPAPPAHSSASTSFLAPMCRPCRRPSPPLNAAGYGATIWKCCGCIIATR